MKTIQVVGVVAAIAVALFVLDSCWRSQNAEWEARVERVQEQARQDSAATQEHIARADVLEQQVDVLQRRVSNRDVAIDGLRDAIASAPIPEESIPAVTLRDELIAEQNAQINDLTVALDIEREAAAELRLALDDSISRGDSLSAVLDDRPRPKPSWLPRISIGPFAGICTDASTCTGVGVQLSWEVKLF